MRDSPNCHEIHQFIWYSRLQSENHREGIKYLGYVAVQLQKRVRRKFCKATSDKYVSGNYHPASGNYNHAPETWELAGYIPSTILPKQNKMGK